jgi:hypothetical protein
MDLLRDLVERDWGELESFWLRKKRTISREKDEEAYAIKSFIGGRKGILGRAGPMPKFELMFYIIRFR